MQNTILSFKLSVCSSSLLNSFPSNLLIILVFPTPLSPKKIEYKYPSFSFNNDSYFFALALFFPPEQHPLSPPLLSLFKLFNLIIFSFLSSLLFKDLFLFRYAITRLFTNRSIEILLSFADNKLKIAL